MVNWNIRWLVGAALNIFVAYKSYEYEYFVLAVFAVFAATVSFVEWHQNNKNKGLT